jgi:hypothetical protein
MTEPMKFYCAGAIRGELLYKDYFDKIIEIVKDFGEPLTEKVAYKIYPLQRYADLKEQEKQEKLVAERDRRMIRQCHAMIAEFSGPSTGTGWEICYATRVQRKPALCLYNKNSIPSLIIKQDDVLGSLQPPSSIIRQDNCKYTIIQEYSDEREFEGYVRCFLEVVTRASSIDDIRRIYIKAKKIVKQNPHPYEIRRYVESLIEKSLKKAGVEIDFTDANQFLQFLFKTLILQRRWTMLKSQRIGSTFVSGRKPKIIKALARFEGRVNLSRIYNSLGEDKIKYTREAFTKNVRAFRKIGLIGAQGTNSLHLQRGTKFKDQLMFVKTFSGNVEIKSSRSPRETLRGYIIITQYLRHLAKFLERHGAEPLVNFLQQFQKMDLYSEILDIPVHNIDKVDVSMSLDDERVQKLLANLHLEGKKIWKEIYSSFA